MFHDVAIASTALSSFNNAALFAPLFLTIGFLALPLFFMVYICGRDFVTKFGWNNQNVERQSCFWICLITALWLILFGGNYAVLRDGISLLPVLVAGVLFLLTIAVFHQFVKLNYLPKLQNIKYKWLYLLLILLVIGLSGKPVLWGFLLQISAFFCGMIVGCRLHKNISLVSYVVPLLLALLMLILMQPEYFRFGQLGNLTIVHLLSVLLTGFFAITAMVTKIIQPKDKIRASAYIKLKWLFRIFSLLALALFLLTESVPVFIGLLVCVALMEILSIYHAKNINRGITKQSAALFVFCFGIIIVCPVISSLAIIYTLFNKNTVKAKNYMGLL